MKGKDKRKTFMFVTPVILILLLSVITPGLVHAEDVDNEGNNYIVRDPIRIDGNSDFAAQAAAEGWPGDGSEGNPYVIEGYEIDGTGYGYGIYVGNTSVHFVVRGCYVHNASGVEWKSDNGISSHKPIYNSGIILFNVKNGSLGDNILIDSGRGIKLFDSSNNNIKNNRISNNSSGIRLTISHRNTIIHNEINGTSSRSGGINLQHSDNNIINNNTLSNHSVGIYEDTCDGNLFEDNIFVNVETELLSVYETNGPIEEYSIPLALLITIGLIFVVILIVCTMTYKKGVRERRKKEIDEYENRKEGYKERGYI